MKKTILFSALFFSFNYFVEAQGKLGNLIHSVKDKTQDVKSTVDLVKPEEKKKEEPKDNSQTTAQDTSKKTTTSTPTTGTTNASPNGSTNNLAIGDQGSNTDEKKGNSSQVKNFVKGSKDNGTKDKPYTNGTSTSNLAIGDQGAVEDKGPSTTTKNNSNTNSQNNNVAPQNNNTTITPK